MYQTSNAHEPDLERLNKAYGLLKTDHKNAIRELKELAVMGSLLSMVHLGWVYQKGVGTDVNTAEAERWLLRAYHGGSNMGAYYLGHLYMEEKNYLSAIKVFAAGASNKYPPAMYCLAHMYLDGLGIQPQEDVARTLLEEAADLGHIFAKGTLARLLMSGKYGVSSMAKGFVMFIGTLKDVMVVGITDPSSERLFT